jgi:hypothetical protein
MADQLPVLLADVTHDFHGQLSIDDLYAANVSPFGSHRKK